MPIAPSKSTKRRILTEARRLVSRGVYPSYQAVAERLPGIPDRTIRNRLAELTQAGELKIPDAVMATRLKYHRFITCIRDRLARNETPTQEAIATAIGISLKTATDYAKRARKAGLIPKGVVLWSEATVATHRQLKRDIRMSGNSKRVLEIALQFAQEGVRPTAALIHPHCPQLTYRIVERYLGHHRTCGRIPTVVVGAAESTAGATIALVDARPTAVVLTTKSPAPPATTPPAITAPVIPSAAQLKEYPLTPLVRKILVTANAIIAEGYHPYPTRVLARHPGFSARTVNHALDTLRRCGYLVLPEGLDRSYPEWLARGRCGEQGSEGDVNAKAAELLAEELRDGTILREISNQIKESRQKEARRLIKMRGEPKAERARRGAKKARREYREAMKRLRAVKPKLAVATGASKVGVNGATVATVAPPKVGTGDGASAGYRRERAS